ncbi:MAG: hypothetical protein ABSC37_03940 [Xanthobacteraceae bacterium]|jgi:hypothetical protein
MTTSTRLIVALTLLLSATAGAFAASKPLYNSAATNDPAVTGGGSSGYNDLADSRNAD